MFAQRVILRFCRPCPVSRPATLPRHFSAVRGRLQHPAAINKFISGSETLESLREKVQAYKHDFDEIHVTTSMWHAVRLSRRRLGQGKKGQQNRKEIVQLLKEISPLVVQHADSLNTRCLGTVMKSFGILKFNPGPNLVGVLLQSAEKDLFRFKGDELSSLITGVEHIYCHSTDSIEPDSTYHDDVFDFEFVDTLDLVLESKLASLSPGEITSILQALSKLNRIGHLSMELLDSYRDALLNPETLKRYDAKSLSRVLWLAAKDNSGFPRDQQLLETITVHLRSVLSTADGSDLATILWAFQQLEFNPGSQFLDEFCVYSGAKLAKMQPRDFATVLYSLASMKRKYVPTKTFLSMVNQSFEKKLKRCNGHSLSVAFLGITRLVPPDDFVMDIFTERIETLVNANAFGSQALIMILVSYENWGGNPGEHILGLIAQEILSNAALTPVYLTTVLRTFAKLDYYPGDKEMVELLGKGLHECNLKSFDPGSLVRLVSSFSMLHFYPGDKFMREFLNVIEVPEEDFGEDETVEQFGVGSNFDISEMGIDSDDSMLDYIQQYDRLHERSQVFLGDELGGGASALSIKCFGGDEEDDEVTFDQGGHDKPAMRAEQKLIVTESLSSLMRLKEMMNGSAGRGPDDAFAHY